MIDKQVIRAFLDLLINLDETVTGAVVIKPVPRSIPYVECITCVLAENNLSFQDFEKRVKKQIEALEKSSQIAGQVHFPFALDNGPDISALFLVQAGNLRNQLEIVKEAFAHLPDNLCAGEKNMEGK